MNAKPWQIALIVIGLAVGVGSAAWFVLGGDDVKLDRRYFLVDVENGDIYEVDSTKYRLVLPARHPETGRTVLIGIHKAEDGGWYVPKRDLGTVSQLEKGVQVKAINPETGDLINPPATPKRYATK